MEERKVSLRLISFGLICGVSITSILALSLNVPYINLIAFVLLTGGGTVAAVPPESGGLGLSVLVLVGDVLIYSGVTVAIAFGIQAKSRTLRASSAGLAAPAVILGCLACIPALDPMIPAGMTTLLSKEMELQKDIPIGADLDQVRATLHSRGIRFDEQLQDAGGVVLRRKDGTISANAGDLVIFARLPTGAGRFPCGYDIEIFMLFGHEGMLKQRYIHRFAVCL